MKDTQVIVVGAGVIGLACAHALLRQGFKVTIVERGLPGGANSTLTGGGVREQFLTTTNIGLSRLSAPWWENFQAQFGVDPKFNPIGYLFLARRDADARLLRANVAEQNRLNVDSEYLDEAEIPRRWPILSGREFIGAAFRQRDGWVNQHRVIDGLYRAVIARGGRLEVGVECLAINRTQQVVTGIDTTGGRMGADAVVLATGPWAASLLAPLDIRLPLSARRHELLVVEPAERMPRGLPWLIDVDAQVHCRSDAPGRALVGGFMGRDEAVDPDDYARGADHAWKHAVLTKVGRRLGIIDARAVIRNSWAGLYPSTPDHHPIIDRLLPGLYVALGFSGTGLMHAPAAGKLVAEMLVSGTIRSIESAPLRADRFGPASQAAAETTGF